MKKCSTNIKGYVTKISYPIHLLIKIGGRWNPPIKVEDGAQLKREIGVAKEMYGAISDFKTERISGKEKGNR